MTSDLYLDKTGRIRSRPRTVGEVSPKHARELFAQLGLAHGLLAGPPDALRWEVRDDGPPADGWRPSIASFGELRRLPLPELVEAARWVFEQGRRRVDALEVDAGQALAETRQQLHVLVGKTRDGDEALRTLWAEVTPRLFALDRALASFGGRMDREAASGFSPLRAGHVARDAAWAVLHEGLGACDKSTRVALVGLVSVAAGWEPLDPEASTPGAVRWKQLKDRITKRLQRPSTDLALRLLGAEPRRPVDDVIWDEDTLQADLESARVSARMLGETPAPVTDLVGVASAAAAEAAQTSTQVLELARRGVEYASERAAYVAFRGWVTRGEVRPDWFRPLPPLLTGDEPAPPPWLGYFGGTHGTGAAVALASALLRGLLESRPT